MTVRGKNQLHKLNLILNNKKKYEKNINQLIKENIKIGKTKSNLFKFLNKN